MTISKLQTQSRELTDRSRVICAESSANASATLWRDIEDSEGEEEFICTWEITHIDHLGIATEEAIEENGEVLNEALFNIGVRRERNRKGNQRGDKALCTYIGFGGRSRRQSGWKRVGKSQPFF